MIVWLKKHPCLAGVFLILFLVLGYSLIKPNITSSQGYATVFYDAEGQLIGARIPSDGQWRFPSRDTVPHYFSLFLTTFEDERFGSHIGVDVKALSRALYANIQAGHVVSGGSTLTMQLARMCIGQRKSRNIFQKAREVAWALKAEIYYSKQEILSAYASLAPFGGNVVGLEAASWRYFAKPSQSLSISECALLAVMPNNPSGILLGKNNVALLRKRNALLLKAYKKGFMSVDQYQLALLEDIPSKRYAIPNHAPQWVDFLMKSGIYEKEFKTSLSLEIQDKVHQVYSKHIPKMLSNHIQHAAILVVHVPTGEVRAYQGNLPRDLAKVPQQQVDHIQAPRSSGSILKPFLMGQILQKGLMTDKALVEDIPTIYGGYIPKNFDLTYRGAVPLKQAISRSLNIPAVRLLKQYGISAFQQDLQQLGLKTITRPAHEYGLSLILGGAECTLWDVCGAYAYLVRDLQTGVRLHGNHLKTDKHALQVQKQFRPAPAQKDYVKTIDWNGGVTWSVLKAMQEVIRPDADAGWMEFSSRQDIAWKTGTSFGNRDAWAVGMTSEYLVGVWVGNADGQGRAELTGISYAAPILFDVFQTLPVSAPFLSPEEERVKMSLCTSSGYKSGPYCSQTDTIQQATTVVNSPLCPYCKPILLDQKSKFQVFQHCSENLVPRLMHWFVLPPEMEHYYVLYHSDYKPLPPIDPNCNVSEMSTKKLKCLYPIQGSIITLSKSMDGEAGKVVCQVACSEAHTWVYWTLDGRYLGKTQKMHQWNITLGLGKHRLTVLNDLGDVDEVQFDVIEG